jgi:hypothetical protein
MKLQKYFALATVFGLMASFLLLAGCQKKPVPSENNTVSPLGAYANPTNWVMVMGTEEKDRDDFCVRIRSVFETGGYETLEKEAEEYRTKKSRFPNGKWKLPLFYSAFGCLPEAMPTNQWPAYVAKLEKWATMDTNSFTARLALVEAYHGYAWVARGSGWASEVTQEGERLMDERIKKSFDWLWAAQKVQGAEQSPEFYAEVLHACLGANVERSFYEEMFEAGLKSAPDYTALYQSKAYYLLPRWYGKEGEWETFARTMTKRADILNHEEIFARVALSLRGSVGFYDEFSGDDQAWEELKASFRAAEKNYPGSLELKSIFCKMSAKMYDYKEAQAQLKLLGGKVDLSVWDSSTNFFTAVEWLNHDDAALEDCRRQFKAEQKQKRSN